MDGEALPRAETTHRPLARLLALDFAVSRRRRGDEPRHELLGGARDLFDRAIERLVIGLRRTRASAHLAHVLERGVVHLFGRGRRVEVEQRANVAAHEDSIYDRTRDRARRPAARGRPGPRDIAPFYGSGVQTARRAGKRAPLAAG